MNTNQMRKLHPAMGLMGFLGILGILGFTFNQASFCTFFAFFGFFPGFGGQSSPTSHGMNAWLQTNFAQLIKPSPSVLA